MTEPEQDTGRARPDEDPERQVDTDTPIARREGSPRRGVAEAPPPPVRELQAGRPSAGGVINPREHGQAASLDGTQQAIHSLPVARGASFRDHPPNSPRSPGPSYAAPVTLRFCPTKP